MTDKRQRIADIADACGIDLSEEATAEILDGEESLREDFDELASTTTTREPVGNFADDNDALLYVYDSPRTTESSGSLDGTSLALKDNIAVDGLRMTCGISDRAYVPPFDATVVRRLLSEGASIVGKANMDLLAFGPTGEYSGFETPTNPIDAERVPGGSSSGSGVAVASGTVDAALGTDTGGSIRIPAACCGIVGVKPTHRLVPRHGLVELAPSLDAIGPLAPDAETAGRVLDAIKGQDPDDAVSSPVETGSIDTDVDTSEEFIIGVPQEFLDVSSDPVVAALDDLTTALEDETAVTVRDVSVDLSGVIPAYAMNTSVEFLSLIRQGGVVRGEGAWYDQAWTEGFTTLVDGSVSEHIAERVFPSVLVDEEMDGRAYVAARKRRQRLRRDVEQLLDEVDLLLTPTLRILPPRLDEVTYSESIVSVIGNTAPFNLTGHPAVTVPGGTVDGLSLGVQVVADHFADERALQGAKVIESVHQEQ